MTVRELAFRVATALMACACATAAVAAEIRVLSPAAVKGPVTEIAAAFGGVTGHRVVLAFATAGQVESRVEAGERADFAAALATGLRRARFKAAGSDWARRSGLACRSYGGC